MWTAFFVYFLLFRPNKNWIPFVRVIVFRYDLIDDKWIYSHDGVSLDSLLNDEFRRLFGSDKIDFTKHLWTPYRRWLWCERTGVLLVVGMLIFLILVVFSKRRKASIGRSRNKKKHCSFFLFPPPKNCKDKRFDESGDRRYQGRIGGELKIIETRKIWGYLMIGYSMERMNRCTRGTLERRLF